MMLGNGLPIAHIALGNSRYWLNITAFVDGPADDATPCRTYELMPYSGDIVSIPASSPADTSVSGQRLGSSSTRWAESPG